MSNKTLRLESFKRDPDMLCDKTEYTAISHSSHEFKTVIDWPVHVECSPLTRLYVAKINIKTDLFDSEAEALDQLGRWMIRLGEVLRNKDPS